MKRVLLAGTAALVVGVGLTGCSSPVTHDRLAAQFGPTFARLYAYKQDELGQVAPPRGPDGTARCGRGGAVSGGTGAGDDWTCTVVYPFGDGHLQPITYDVTVAATGCWTADGPSAVVGRATISTPDGRDVLNPLFAIDGCLDVA